MLEHLLEGDRLVGIQRPARLVLHPVLRVRVLEVVRGGESQRRARDAEQDVEGDAPWAVQREPRRDERRAPVVASRALPTRRYARRDVHESDDEHRDVHRTHSSVPSAVLWQEQPLKVGSHEREDELEHEDAHGRCWIRVRLRHEPRDAFLKRWHHRRCLRGDPAAVVGSRDHRDPPGRAAHE